MASGIFQEKKGWASDKIRRLEKETVALSPLEEASMDENKLLERITVNPKIFAGKPIIRGRRIAVEHILGMLAAGDAPETILKGYPWLEMEDIQACLVYARRMVSHERVEPRFWGQRKVRRCGRYLQLCLGKSNDKKIAALCYFEN